MKRKLFVGLLVAVCFILQNTIMNSLALASIEPNLLIIITASYGFMRGRKSGMWVGFFSGLLLDVFYGGTLGAYTALYMYIGYFNGFFRKVFYPEEVRLPMVLIALSDLIYSLAVYLGSFLLRGKFEFFYYFIRIILPEMIYTLVVSIPLYWLVLHVNTSFEKSENRRR